MSSPDAQVRNFVKEYERLHVTRRLINELENELQNNSNAEYNLVRLEGRYTWKCNPKENSQNTTPGKQMPYTPNGSNRRKMWSEKKGGVMSGVSNGMSWGLTAFMENLEQAAANMF